MKYGHARTQPASPVSARRGVVFGLVVMLIGTLLLLDRLDWWGVRLNVPLWPWVLIVLGLVRLSDRSTDAQRRHARAPVGGVAAASSARWGLLNEYRLFGLHYGHSWPLLLIGAGVMMVWRSMDQSRPIGRAARAVNASPNHG